MLELALRRREREASFDLEQSADYLASGLFVQRLRRRPHLVLCGSTPDLYAEADRNDGGDPALSRWGVRLKQSSARRADIAYAPSRYVADHLRRSYELGLEVVRPPVFLETRAEESPPLPLPDRN